MGLHTEPQRAAPGDGPSLRKGTVLAVHATATVECTPPRTRPTSPFALLQNRTKEKTHKATPSLFENRWMTSSTALPIDAHRPPKNQIDNTTPPAFACIDLSSAILHHPTDVPFLIDSDFTRATEGFTIARSVTAFRTAYPSWSLLKYTCTRCPARHQASILRAHHANVRRS